MFELIESCPDQRPGFGWTGKAVSLAVHAFVISAAIAATKGVARDRGYHPTDTSLVWVNAPPVRREQASPAARLPGLPVSAPWHALVIPTAVPTDIPSPGTSAFIDPGIPGAPIPGIPGGDPIGTPVIGDAPRDVRLVDEPPQLVSHPPVRYPEALRLAGIEGHVMIETVLDTLGHAEPAQTRVTRSGTDRFDREALRVVLASRYRAARVGGRAVRVRIAVPVNFLLRP